MKLRNKKLYKLLSNEITRRLDYLTYVIILFDFF